MAVNYNDIADYRYNSFTKVYTPRQIGYAAEPVEERIVPAVSPYIIQLYEFPQQNVPSTTAINIKAGSNLKEVLASKNPGNLEFRVQYDSLGGGQVQFNAAQAGQTVEIKYYGLGTVHQKATLDSRAATEQIVPVGGIIGVHPETTLAKAIDTDFWEPCDSSGGNITLTYQDGTTQVIARPDLSDDRFLMGDNLTSVNRTGSNTHNHIWNNEDTSGGSYTNGKVSFESQATLYDNHGYDSSGNPTAWPTTYLNADAYTGNTDSKPRHFSVLYYIRIK
jgi:hypothetical protein